MSVTTRVTEAPDVTSASSPSPFASSHTRLAQGGTDVTSGALMGSKVMQHQTPLSDSRSVVIRDARPKYHCFLDSWEGRWFIRYQEAGGKERQQFRYRFLMECYLGRKLLRSEIIHHRNHIKTDDRIENLELTNNRDHILTHVAEAKAVGIIWGLTHLPTNDRPNGMRYCSRCATEKPLDQFRLRNPAHKKGKIQTYCKTCQDRASANYRPPGYWKNYYQIRKAREAVRQ